MIQHNPMANPVRQAVDRQDFGALAREFNASLADLPDDDLPQRDGDWYRSMFHAFLIGSGVPAPPGAASGAADLVIQNGRCLYYIAFGFAGESRLAACRLREAGEKLKAERAGGAYAGQGWTVYHAAVVADNETGQVSWFCERRHPGCRTRKPSRAAGGHLPSGGGLPSGTPSRADRGGCRTAVAGRGRRQERRPAASQARAQRRPAGG